RTRAGHRRSACVLQACAARECDQLRRRAAGVSTQGSAAAMKARTVMRVRTVYFKVRELKPVREWWRSFLAREPTKDFAEWCEFRVGDVNLGLLPLAEHTPGSGRPSCVPVLEFSDDEIVAVIARARQLAATVLLEGEAHPDHPKVA